MLFICNYLSSLRLSLSLSSAHYYGRHIALINGAECVRLNFQFACNDLIVHNFVIWLTQIPLNDNDFMQFMGRACRATDPRPVRTCNKRRDKPGQAGQMRRLEHDSQLIHYQLHVIYAHIYIYVCIWSIYVFALSGWTLQGPLHFIAGPRWLNINVIYYSN